MTPTFDPTYDVREWEKLELQLKRMHCLPETTLGTVEILTQNGRIKHIKAAPVYHRPA